MQAVDLHSVESKQFVQKQLDNLLAPSRFRQNMWTLWADFDTYAHLLWRLQRKRDSRTMLMDLLNRYPSPVDPATHVFICLRKSPTDMSIEVITQAQFQRFQEKARQNRLWIPWGNEMHPWHTIVHQMIEGSKYPLDFRLELETYRIEGAQSEVIVPWISQ